MSYRTRHFQGADNLGAGALAGLRLLIVEDEFLIAMDVEQICRDHGAREVAIFGNVGDLGPEPFDTIDFDAAIIDIMVDGEPTLDFARQMRKRNVPFIFATGYSDREEIFAEFPGVPVVGKPYAGSDLIEALAAAIAARRPSDGV